MPASIYIGRSHADFHKTFGTFCLYALFSVREIRPSQAISSLKNIYFKNWAIL
jgi:hypothetical protein